MVLHTLMGCREVEGSMGRAAVGVPRASQAVIMELRAAGKESVRIARNVFTGRKVYVPEPKARTDGAGRDEIGGAPWH